MKNSSLIIFLVLVVLGGSAQSISRKVMPTAGGNLAAGAYQIDFTIGEPLTTTLVSGANMITQGFQQPDTWPGACSSIPPLGAASLAYNNESANINITGTQSASLTVTNASCRMICALLPSGSFPVSGSVTAKVWVDASVQQQNGTPYLQRHYEISPTSNAGNATATITLYYTQAEFDAYNLETDAGLFSLPTSPLSDKTFLRIYQYHGSSTGATGLPGSYTGTTTTINPDDRKIVWNSSLQRWEVTFSVAGFSGFFMGVDGLNIFAGQVAFFYRCVSPR